VEKSQQLSHQKNDRELLSYFCQTTYVGKILNKNEDLLRQNERLLEKDLQMQRMNKIILDEIETRKLFFQYSFRLGRTNNIQSDNYRLISRKEN